MRIRPHTMLLMMLAGWLNRHQQEMIEYLREENKILVDKLGHKRIILTDDQRRRLALLGKGLAKKTPIECLDYVLSRNRSPVASRADRQKI